MHRYAFFLLLVLLVVGCQSSPRPLKVVEYPDMAPLASPDPFVAAGCTEAPYSTNLLECTTEALIGIGCAEVLVDPFLGPLTPKPIAFCGTMRDGGPIQFFEKSGVVIGEDDGTFRFIPVRQESYQREFAPIENADQAVAYAHLMTDSMVVNQFEQGITTSERGITEVHETHAEPTDGGFTVNLFGDSQDGNLNDPDCRAYQYEVSVTVTRDGAVTSSEPRRIRETGPCVIY